MRPYLAVIYDSFHAALSSRVLWIAFVAIWILLGAIAPLSYREDYTAKFSRFDFDNGTQLKAMLAQGLADPDQKEKALGRLAAAMPDDLKRKLTRVAQGDEIRIRISLLADALNEAIEDDSWYDAEAWKATPRLQEQRDLDETPDNDLSDALRKRRARLRIQSAVPGVFRARSSRSVLLTYAGFDFPFYLPVGKEQFDLLFNQIVLPRIMSWLLGFALIFLGILVTSSIVPDMLQPGSLHLLLSKPISRSFLLISKFVGGCSFVFLCVCQLVIGLWLIAGWRLDIWNLRLLWCIPVVVFLFAVFFSVSLFAGLRWRSPIISIGVTCMFGAVLMVIWFIGGYFDSFVTRPDTIRSIAVLGEDVLATTRGGEVKRYNDLRSAWVPLLENRPGNSDLLLPIAKLSNDHAATALIPSGRFNPYGSGSLDMLVFDRAGQWEPEPGMRLPTATRRLLVSDQSLLAMNTGGLMRTDVTTVLESAGVEIKDQGADEKPSEGTDQKTAKAGGFRLLDLVMMRGGATDGFHSILPRGVAVVQPARAVTTDNGNSVVLYTLGRLYRLQRPPNGSEDPAWQIAAQRELGGDAAQGAVVALSGSVLLVSRRDEPTRILNAETLETIANWELAENAQVFSAVGLGDGKRFVVVMLSGSSRLLSISDGEITEQPFAVSGISVMKYDKSNETLAVAHHIDQIDILDAKDLEVKKRIRPSSQGWRFVDKYVISTLRMITPQTGELSETVAALVSGESSLAFGQSGASEGEVQRYEIMRPVLSCGIFVCVMLFLSCQYFARSDY